MVGRTDARTRPEIHAQIRIFEWNVLRSCDLGERENLPCLQNRFYLLSFFPFPFFLYLYLLLLDPLVFISESVGCSGVRVPRILTRPFRRYHRRFRRNYRRYRHHRCHYRHYRHLRWQYCHRQPRTNT